MAIGPTEKGYLEKLKASPTLRALRAKEIDAKRADRAALVKELARLREEGPRGGPVPKLEEQERKAKAERDEAGRKFHEAQARAAEAERAVFSTIEARTSREARLEDLLRSSAPPELLGFCDIAQRIAEGVRRKQIAMVCPGFRTPEEYAMALREVRVRMLHAIHEDHDPEAIVREVEEVGVRFRLDMHRAVADTPEQMVF